MAQSVIEFSTNSHNNEDKSNQQYIGTSSSIGISSIVDISDNMDELPVSSHTHGPLQKRGKLVTFYRNGDQHFKGINIPISQKWFVTLETLIIYLNEKISTPTGIRHIFNLSNSCEIKDVSEFQPGENYIVSSVKSLIQDTMYGSSFEKYWQNKPISAGKSRKKDLYLFMKNYEDINQIRTSQLSLREQPQTQRQTRNINKKSSGRKIKVISNTNRDINHEIYVYRKTDKSYEDLLYDMSEMFHSAQIPIQTLYTMSKPHKRICSHSQLFTEFLHEKEFLACGTEFYPLEFKKSKGKLVKEKVYAFSSDSLESKLLSSDRQYTTKCTQTEETTIHENITIPISQRKFQTRNKKYLTIRDKERVVYPVKVPKHVNKSNEILQNLKLNWIYGFNCNVLGDCIEVISSDEFLYAISRVLVIYNVTNFNQRYFMEHTTNVTCFCIHSNRKYAASAQMKGEIDSLIYIWDLCDCNVLYILTTGFSERILSLDFSKEGQGEYILILDGNTKNKDQSLIIYDWRNSTKVTSTKCNREEVTRGKFHTDDNTTIVSIGYQHVNVWRIFWQDKGQAKILRDKKSGLFDICIPETVSCMTFDLVGNFLTGDSNGSIHLWVRDEEDAFVNRTVPQLFHAHKDYVACLLIIGDGTMVSASQSSLKAWDTFNDFRFVKERNIASQYGCIKAIAAAHPEKIDGKLWIGTDFSVVLEGSLQESFIVVFQCHRSCSPSLRLSSSPNEHCFISVGLDRLIIKWSILQQRLIWSTIIESPCSSVCYYKGGSYIAVGTSSGRLVIIKDKSGAHVMSLQIDPSQKPISCLQYSPDGKYLIICSSSNDMMLYSVMDLGLFYRFIPEMQFKNSKNIQRVDWSVDSNYIRTENADFDSRLWSLNPSVKEKDLSEVINIDFNTENCLVTYNNYNTWKNPLIDEVSATKKSLNTGIIAYGTSKGFISLNDYQEIENKEERQMSRISCEGVQDVEISFDDSFLLNTYNEQNCPCIIQWKIEKDKFHV